MILRRNVNRMKRGSEMRQKKGAEKTIEKEKDSYSISVKCTIFYCLSFIFSYYNSIR